MRAHEYDALAFTGSDWFEWVANHSLPDQAFERPFLLVVTSAGESFAILSELSRNGAAAHRRRGDSWVASYVHYTESPDTARHRWIATQLRELVVDVVRTAGLTRARIGVQMQNGWLSEAFALLPDLRVSSAGAELNSLRWIKHPEEIATMRECAALTDWALDRYREELRPGRLLAEVDYLIAARLVAEAAKRLPGENFVIKNLTTLSGAASACSGGDGTNGKMLEADTVATTGLGTRLNGLAMELGRPWLVGTPDRRIIELFDCARAAQQAALEACVVGRPVSGIHAAAQKVFDAAGHGAHLRLRGGHGIGVIQHDFPVDVPFDGRPLLEHEVYAVEPSLYIAEIGGFRFADTVVVRASAPEQLTKTSKERAALSLN